MLSRRQKVMHVAQQLFLEKGFAETSVQDILNEAHISKGTFYNYFSTKNDCLIAILKNAQQETIMRRENLINKAKYDNKQIFAQQIIVRMDINREHNLMPLLGFIFHSKDEELRRYAKEQHLIELTWLSKRIIELYGEEVRPVVVDCAVMLFGMVQQYNLVWAFYAADELPRQQLLAYILRRLDVILADLMENQESIIDQQLFLKIQQLMEETVCKDENLMNELINAKKIWENDVYGGQFIEILLEELNKNVPRRVLLESVMKSFIDYTKGSEFMAVTEKIEELLSAYISANLMD